MRYSLTVPAAFMALLVLVPLYSLSAAVQTNTDAVIEWNTVALTIIRTTNTPPPFAARNLAIVHTAVYDAVNSITQTHEPYHARISVSGQASAEAAAVAAAHRALLALYPNHTSQLNSARQSSLARIPDNPAKEEGIRVGTAAAEAILALRSNDNTNSTVQYRQQSGAGKWEPTLPGHLPPLYPHWGSVTPFTKTSLRQFWPQGPPALNSMLYAEEVREVQRLGAKDSPHRTADQTQIAHFWEDGPGTFTPPGHWNVIAQDVATRRGTSLNENARLFALLNIAMADAAILCWDIKYTFNLWRPITAIRKAHTDGNPHTVQDAAWMPLLTTPPFPEYTSGHSTFSGAASIVLAALFNDHTPFTTHDIRNPSIQRSFTSFSQAAEEAAISRLYGGIHFRSGNQHGLDTGNALGTYVAMQMLKPLAVTPAMQAQHPFPTPRWGSAVVLPSPTPPSVSNPILSPWRTAASRLQSAFTFSFPQFSW